MPARRGGPRRHVLPDRPRAATAAARSGFRPPRPRTRSTAVSDRDFVLETLGIAAICATHLSRLAEEIILWVTPQFGFAALSDKFDRPGSSIMPQKRNPDAAELVRGKTGRIIAAAQGLLIVMKGLPPHLFQGHAGGQGRHVSIRCSRCRSAWPQRRAWCATSHRTSRGCMRRPARVYATATDLADWLVRCLDMPFRDAHHVTGAARRPRRGARHRPRRIEPRRDAGRRTAHHAGGVRTYSASTPPLRAARVSAARAPDNVRREAEGWIARLMAERAPRVSADGSETLNGRFLACQILLTGLIARRRQRVARPARLPHRLSRRDQSRRRPDRHRRRRRFAHACDRRRSKRSTNCFR